MVQVGSSCAKFPSHRRTPVFLPATSFCSCGSVILGLKAASDCRAPSSSDALLLYSVASALILSLSWLSFRGYLKCPTVTNVRVLRRARSDLGTGVFLRITFICECFSIWSEARGPDNGLTPPRDMLKSRGYPTLYQLRYTAKEED